MPDPSTYEHLDSDQRLRHQHPLNNTPPPGTKPRRRSAGQYNYGREFLKIVAPGSRRCQHPAMVLQHQWILDQ